MIADQSLKVSPGFPVDGVDAAGAPIGYQLLRTLVRLIESRSPGLAGHGDRTAQYAVKLGHAVGLGPCELTDLYFASLLHDVGLLALPSELLKKDGPFSHDEYALVQSHPRLGVELLEPIPWLRQASLWIAHHHERWDGCGYPYGL